MRKISNIYLLLLGLLLLTSCSREDYLKQFKPPIKVSFNSSLSGATGNYNEAALLLSDTIKYSVKKEWKKNLSLSAIDGLSKIQIKDEIGNLINEYPIVAGKTNYELVVPILGLGNYTYRIILLDISGQTKTIQTTIHSFNNWLPVAKMAVNTTEKKMDFSSSYDADARFGGSVYEYRVYINNNLRKQDENPYFLLTENNGFTVGQSYLFKLEVIDSDGATHAVEQNVTIQ